MSAEPRPTHPAESGGPYLAMAVLCEKVLTEQDGVLSVIRVVDRIIQSAVGPEAPADMPPVTVQLTALIVLKSGEARGRHTVTVRLELPSGQAGNEMPLPVLLEGEDRGVNLIVNLQFLADQEGLYWFDVLLDGDERVLTRMPLRIVYQPQRTQGMPPG